jgi:predicted thioesterase
MAILPLDPTTLMGRVGQATITVGPAATAIAAGSGDLPVLATPRMVALMEEAACAALAGALPDGLTSVGTRVDVAHRAASPLGWVVTATARVTGVSGARVTFEVVATHSRPVGVSGGDEAAEIGGGTHVRVVVERESFLAGLQ